MLRNNLEIAKNAMTSEKFNVRRDNKLVKGHAHCSNALASFLLVVFSTSPLADIPLLFAMIGCLLIVQKRAKTANNPVK